MKRICSNNFISALKILLVSVLLAFCATAEKSERDRNNLLLFEEYSYSGISLDISNETENARATAWRPDGSMLFVTGRYTENVVSYSLEEPWNIGTATFSAEFDLAEDLGNSSQSSVAHGLFLHNDGALMLVFNRTEIWEFTLETPWNLASAVQTSYFDLQKYVQRGHDFDFKADGSRFFIDDRDAQAVHEFYLETPWDISTMKWEYTLDISDQENAVRGLELVLEGTVMLLMDTGRKEVLQYQLSEPYSLKSARFINAFNVSEETGNPRGLSIRPDLEFFYVTGNDNQKIYQYTRRSSY
ncbi:MAG: hypothetical protein LAT67_10145 [Balneolales bacterium]|nr:hypothetical protein [Balneolales bacterium]